MSGIVYDDKGRYTEQMLEYDKQLSGQIHIIVEDIYNYVSHNGGSPQDFQHLKVIAIETLLEKMSGGYAADTTE